VVVFLVNWHENQSKISLYEQFAATDQRVLFGERRCCREHSRFCQQLYRQCRHPQKKFLYVDLNTCICAGNDSSVVSESHDGCSHVFFGVKEVFCLLVLGCSRTVHRYFKNNSNDDTQLLNINNIFLMNKKKIKKIKEFSKFHCFLQIF